MATSKFDLADLYVLQADCYYDKNQSHMIHYLKCRKIIFRMF